MFRIIFRNRIFTPDLDLSLYMVPCSGTLLILGLGTLTTSNVFSTGKYSQFHLQPSSLNLIPQKTPNQHSSLPVFPAFHFRGNSPCARHVDTSCTPILLSARPGARKIRHELYTVIRNTVSLHDTQRDSIYHHHICTVDLTTLSRCRKTIAARAQFCSWLTLQWDSCWSGKQQQQQQPGGGCPPYHPHYEAAAVVLFNNRWLSRLSAHCRWKSVKYILF